jgi:hypothetical protein
MTSTTYTNPITAHYLKETQLYGGESSTPAQTGQSPDIERILAELEMFGGGDFSGTGRGQGPRSNRGRTAVMNRPGFARYPASQLDAQGLKNVKLTEKDGTTLNLREDAAGDLYDGNKEIGQINEDGSVTLNSSAGDEIKKLKDGAGDKQSHWYNPLSWGNEDKNKPDSSGNVTFGSDQVTVNPGDLTPGQQAPGLNTAADFGSDSDPFETGASADPVAYSGYPGSQLDAQGLKNVKLTQKNGTTLNLREDAAGDLYDGNKEIGQINEDGSITLNSSAGDEIKKLKDGAGDKESHWYNPFSWGNEDKSKTDSSGNVTFGADQVTVNPGDLTPTSQATQQAGPVIPTPRRPSFYSLQMNIQPIPAGSSQSDIEET